MWEGGDYVGLGSKDISMTGFHEASAIAQPGDRAVIPPIWKAETKALQVPSQSGIQIEFKATLDNTVRLYFKIKEAGVWLSGKAPT